MDLRTEAHRGYLRRWLQYLMYFHGAGLALGVASFVPALEGFCSLASYLVTVLVIVALFRLGRGLVRYRRAAVFMAGGLCFQLVNYCFNLLMLGQVVYIPENAVAFGLISGVLTTGATVCSFFALYHAYYTHAGLCVEFDPAMSERWKGLFLWTLIAGVGATVVTAVCAVLGQTAVAAGATLIYGAATMVFEVLRILWLHRMVRMLKRDGSTEK